MYHFFIKRAVELSTNWKRTMFLTVVLFKILAYKTSLFMETKKD